MFGKRDEYLTGARYYSSKGGASRRALGHYGVATCGGVDKRQSGGTHSTKIFQIGEEYN